MRYSPFASVATADSATAVGYVVIAYVVSVGAKLTSGTSKANGDVRRIDVASSAIENAVYQPL